MFNPDSQPPTRFHEAHHRGQIAMLAHQLGHPLPAKISSDLWDWQKLWKQTNGAPIGDAVR